MFDFDLGFLQGFVDKQLAEGKKTYSLEKRQQYGVGDLTGMELVAKGELNFKPYVNPNAGRVNADLQQSNPLYMESLPPTDSALQINTAKKVWGQPVP